MSKEIERKYLVADGWRADVGSPGTEMCQAYLSTDPHATVRVRVAGARAWLTIKGENDGIARDEWEYEIPATEAREMTERCGKAVLCKTRYRVGRWEIDEYHGSLEGLVVAEIELTSAEEQIELPAWILREVSGDTRYYNSCLAESGTIPV